MGLTAWERFEACCFALWLAGMSLPALEGSVTSDDFPQTEAALGFDGRVECSGVSPFGFPLWDFFPTWPGDFLLWPAPWALIIITIIIGNLWPPIS